MSVKFFAATDVTQEPEPSSNAVPPQDMDFVIDERRIDEPMEHAGATRRVGGKFSTANVEELQRKCDESKSHAYNIELLFGAKLEEDKIRAVRQRIKDDALQRSIALHIDLQEAQLES